MIASGILILVSVGSLAAKAGGLTKSSLFGDATLYVALGAIAVMGLAIWSDANRAEERAPGFGKKPASKETAAVRELPLWLSAWTKVVHYPTMLAGTTGIALLLGDSSWIEKHSHTEPWATKLAGLAVLATAAYVFVAARRITSKEPSDENSKSTVSRKKHA
jgi:hypothetical protein